MWAIWQCSFAESARRTIQRCALGNRKPSAGNIKPAFAKN
jgi:hypothetical protein